MSITDDIGSALAEIEQSEDVTIFYACESGSRAWGFESNDSDYDVRFLYAHRNSWYLSLDARRDVIERPISDVLDVSGWDARKALALMKRSNPPLFEWLSSPIVYKDMPNVTNLMRAHVERCYSRKSTFHHYLHMAQGNYRDYLRGEVVKVKKYFYVLRPLLACIWLERDMGFVPMEFNKLVSAVLREGPVVAAIADLLVAKRAGCELDRGPKISALSEFIDAELCRLSNTSIDTLERVDGEKMDVLFRAMLMEMNGKQIIEPSAAADAQKAALR